MQEFSGLFWLPDLLTTGKCIFFSITSFTFFDVQMYNNMSFQYRYTLKPTSLQASLRGKMSEFDAYVLFLHKNAIQVLVPTIGQQLTLYLDSREKKKEEKGGKRKEENAGKEEKAGKKEEKAGKKKSDKSPEAMEVDEQESGPEFEFDEQVSCHSVLEVN